MPQRPGSDSAASFPQPRGAPPQRAGIPGPAGLVARGKSPLRPFFARATLQTRYQTRYQTLHHALQLFSPLAALIAGGLFAAEPLAVDPGEIRLVGPFDRVQLVVRQPEADGTLGPRAEDRTRVATYEVEPAGLVAIEAPGLLRGLLDGAGILTITDGGGSVRVPVQVSGVSPADAAAGADFLRDVRPVLARAGCAAGACHAAQHGQGGFKLSVFGHDFAADYDAIARAGRGRRVNPAHPAGSLLLEKPSQQLPHGGGLRLLPGSVEYRVLERWIAAGCPRPTDPQLAVTGLEIRPAERIGQPGMAQQFRVVAAYSDGTSRDVTALGTFESIDEGVVEVEPSGRGSAVGRGQGAVMVRYEGRVATASVVVPFAERGPGQATVAAGWEGDLHGPIDAPAAEKFAALGLVPSPPCDDATFIRRAHLDALGSLPDPAAVEAFLAAGEPDKRARLVDRLLGLTGDPTQDVHNDRYAAFWTLRWSDLLRNSSASIGPQGMWAFHNWLRDSFRVNKPYDRLVRELITARGSIYSNGPANFFRVYADATLQTEATSQLFLGLRLDCAKCHQHPFESLSQADYYGMAAFFARVASKPSEDFGLFGGDMVVMVGQTGETSHPRTGARLAPKPLGGEPTDHPLDRREPLADWLTSPDNPAFARAIVNRCMGWLLGRGLVHPVDDMRTTNPPSDERMLAELAADFVAHGHDLKHLLRTIMTSRLYSLSSQPTPENAADRRFYSHFAVRRIEAEPLLDCIADATGVPMKFKDLPAGTRAVDLPDAEYPDHFLVTFAKPRRVSVCECERARDPNLAQSLHTLNGDTIATKVAAPEGRLGRLLAAGADHETIIQQLWLGALSRLPDDAEMEATREIVAAAPAAAEGYQDLFWALLNSKQFLFVR